MWCGYGRRRIITTGFWPGNIECLLRVLALVGLIGFLALPTWVLKATKVGRFGF